MGKRKPKAKPAQDLGIDPDALRAFEEAARRLITSGPATKRARTPRRATRTRRAKGA
jgi:hypothetical protein